MNREESALGVLRERARRLAQPAARTEDAPQKAPLLLFVRGGARYAIELSCVREVMRLTEHAELPFTKLGCLGIGGARGELYALFDVRAFVTGVPEQREVPAWMVVCGESPDELALAADAVEDLVFLSCAPHPEHGQPSFVTGIDERGFTVLDGAALLTDPCFQLDSLPGDDPA